MARQEETELKGGAPRERCATPLFSSLPQLYCND